MCISSQLEFSVRYTPQVFFIGVALIILGTASWLLIQIYNIVRLNRYQRIKSAKSSSDASPPGKNTRSQSSLRSQRF